MSPLGLLRWCSVLLEALAASTGATAPGFFVAVGFALIVVAIVWRGVLLLWTTRRLHVALSEDDPAARAAAVEVATIQGLTRHAGALLTLVRRETDTTVLDSLSEAVRRHVWEPGDNRKVVELRLWADRRRRESKVSPSLPATTSPAPLPIHDGGLSSVLVTGAGGPAGVNVIRALKTAGHRVIAVDCDPLAAGLRLADEAAVVPLADDPSFCERVVEIARSMRAQALIPTVTEEMVALSDHKDLVEEVVAMWLAPRAALELCGDKWRFACAMREAGICVPPTALSSADDIPGPWVVKPRRDRGSRGVRFVDDRDELEAAIRATEDPIVQTRLRGEEFTVDVLVSRDEELVGAVPRWRIETKGGISTKGRTFSDDRVLEGTAAVLATVHLEGAANVQGFVDGDGVRFVEVNPRFSGGLPLSLAAGADLVGEYLRGVLGLPLRSERLVYADGTTMIRHFEEIYA